jgi:3-phenylpropionate/trans-cinnamate dioxygenase ferredoxin reductase subunit
MDAMLIVGAGECGTRAAFTLRESGWSGGIVLLGDEAGLPYERPPLSKAGADANGVPLRPICSAGQLQAARIDYRPAERVERIDRAGRSVQLQSGAELRYERLLLATGARPRVLGCPGAAGVLQFRSHADALALLQRQQGARNAVLIGAGLIGMELAATLRGAGLAVTVLEAGPRALGRGVPLPLAERLLQRHREAGVQFRFGSGLSAIEAGAVHLVDGSALPADLVLAAIGVEPNTQLAAAAGLQLDNGIAVDACLRSSDALIHAAGDCAAVQLAEGGPRLRFESWRNARDQGEHAARAILGDSALFSAKPWFWSDQYELGLQVAGLCHPERALIRRSLAADTELLFQLDEAGRLSCAAGLGPGQSVARDIRLAELLMSSGKRLDAATLADPARSLKALLRD